MKTILVHHHDGSKAPSSENKVFVCELLTLEHWDREIETVERFSDSILGQGVSGLIKGGFRFHGTAGLLRR